MNDSMEYLQNYVQEDIKMIRSMENAQPEEILEQLEKNLDKTVFGDIGFIMNDGAELQTELSEQSFMLEMF